MTINYLGAVRRLKELAVVPLSVVRPYLAGWDKTRYAAIFKKYGNKNGYRIYIPMDSPSLKADKATPPKEIETFLQGLGFTVDDYKAGLATKDGKRKVKIGKLVISDPKIKKIYDNDSQRSAVKNTRLWCVISRHPYDIVGMSFDRGWTSCMHATAGIYRKYLKGEVQAGSLVAYLIRDDDKNINKPIARISIKPYENGANRILVSSQVYGTAPISFSKVVRTFCEWANSGSPEGTYKLAKGVYRDKLPSTIIIQSPETMLRRASKGSLPQRKKMASDPNTTPEALAILAKDADVGVRWSVANNPSTPPEALAILAKDADVDVRQTLAKNPNTPPAALSLLAKGEDVDVRRGVSENPNTPPEALAILAKDENVGVRWGVSENPNTPSEALSLLVKDKNADIRGSRAKNPNTPPEALSLLARDADVGVRWSVANNPSTPPEALSLLVKDKTAQVRWGVANNPNTLPAALSLLAKDTNAQVRWTLANNPNTPPEVLSLLAKDTNAQVRWGVAKNPSTPPEDARAIDKKAKPA